MNLGLRSLGLIIALAAAIGGAQTTIGNRQAQAIQLNNLGSARMNQERGNDALRLFEQAYKLDPALAIARLNQGIALLAMQQAAAALPVLLDATRLLPNSPRAWYNLGLAHRAAGDSQAALQAFTRAAELDPSDADIHYFVGASEAQLQRYEQAIAAFERANALVPHHASAHFGLARAYQLLGNNERAAQHLARFQQIMADRLAVPLGNIYREQGRYGYVEEAFPQPAAPAAIPVRFASVADAAGLRFIHRSAASQTPTLAQFLGSGACFLDFDSDRRPDLLVLNGTPEATAVLYRNSGNGRFVDVTSGANLSLRGEGLGCTVGDFNNDGMHDIAIGFADRLVLLRNRGNGTFEDVTAASGITAAPFPLGITFVDYDHDGDVDLYVGIFADDPSRSAEPFTFKEDAVPGRNVLWRNNGNGTFTDVTAMTGLAGNSPTIATAATDFNNDRAIDFVLTGRGPKPMVATNRREGAFATSDLWRDAAPGATAASVVLDFNKDGWMDIAFTHWMAPAITLWQNVEGRGFEQVKLPENTWMRAWGIVATDYDNDGWIDLAAVGESPSLGAIQLLRNAGTAGFVDVTSSLGLVALGISNPRTLIAADYDTDGDSDLVITQNHGRVLALRNDGGNRNNWIRFALRGANDNKTGIGTKVEVFAGVLRQKWEIPAASGYLGQSAFDVVAGVGSSRTIDFIRLLWPTGVPQDEDSLAVRRTHVITEIDRRGSSCPVLFTWNGSRFEFITDMIGAGIVGHWVGPGQRNVSDPTEYVKIESRQLKPEAGKLQLRLLEPMEELVYLDHVRLLAVDHPADIDVFPNEYFAAVPPFPEFKVVASRQPRPPAGAWDDHRRDVLSELSRRDRKYVGGFTSTPFAGFAELHSLELDIGEPSSDGPLRLLLHGFIDYFSATSVFAAHQAGITPMLPYIDAQRSDGVWTRAIDNMGFPAGLARTMVADLTGRLPAGTRKIRISTNLKVYWDQILIDRTAESAGLRISEAPIFSANLRFYGYPKQAPGNPPADLSYIYEEVSPTGPYARHAGAHTRLGDVLTVLMASDDRFAIYGSGEEVQLEFDASSLPSVPPGWVRDFFFYADGFDKDMDFYEAYSSSVEPLPYHTAESYPYANPRRLESDPSYLEYVLTLNSRHIAGTAPAGFKFRYGK